ncbi:MAG: hypothetical protein V8S34_01715 [Lawsonibacter sp.]
MLNDKQEIVTFVPDDSNSTTITLSGDAQPGYVKGTDGKQYTISRIPPCTPPQAARGRAIGAPTPPCIRHPGHSVLPAGQDRRRLCQRRRGPSDGRGGGHGAPASAATFHQLTGGATNFTIQKNRQTIRLSDIKPYDVVTYDGLTNTLIVSDLRLTCVYENASPNVKAPEKHHRSGA